MTIRILGILLICFPLVQALPSNPLDQYIKTGLENNLALKQQEFSLEKSLEALKEARGMFFPTISLQGRYSRAGGGRTIEFPVGDLLNPVYGSLNDLFLFHGIIAGYPTDIANEQIPFLRPREQETKIRLIQPLFQPAILHNYKIRSNLSQADRARLDIFKKQLITDIKRAYYDFQKTRKVVELLEKTRDLLEENLRVSENLVKNDMATEDIIYRSQAELADLDQKIAEAEKNRSLAGSYFNFLLNRPLNDPIAPMENSPLPEEILPDLDLAVSNAISKRQEFQQITYAIQASSHQVKLAGSSSLPSLLFVLDYGIQGERYQLGQDDDYWMASLIFDWPLFQGNQTKAKKAQAVLAQKTLELQQAELEQNIRLQVENEYRTLLAARLAVKAAERKELSAKRSFEIVSKKFEFGTSPQIEFLDARTIYTNAAINHIITQFDYLIQLARFDQSAARIKLEIYD